MRVRDGAMLVGGRISVDGYGPGSVVGFNKNYGPGASSHEIRFDQGAPHGLFVLCGERLDSRILAAVLAGLLRAVLLLIGVGAGCGRAQMGRCAC